MIRGTPQSLQAWVWGFSHRQPAIAAQAGRAAAEGYAVMLCDDAQRSASNIVMSHLNCYAGRAEPACEFGDQRG